ncbi:MAG: hypothetical protein DI555_01235 [Novosphingobium pentaromativorans]|uniref:Uncharacterized protein n=1 Tax=Novosphingobium pentaromativorans TaxID=205844 RepID=A0A2W5NVD9_9SPHN|nr:MAG: hypothetical protein DI555_01235 [Novosphingobium pentaromativorans]
MELFGLPPYEGIATLVFLAPPVELALRSHRNAKPASAEWLSRQFDRIDDENLRARTAVELRKLVDATKDIRRADFLTAMDNAREALLASVDDHRAPAPN